MGSLLSHLAFDRFVIMYRVLPFGQVRGKAPLRPPFVFLLHCAGLSEAAADCEALRQIRSIVGSLGIGISSYLRRLKNKKRNPGLDGE